MRSPRVHVFSSDRAAARALARRILAALAAKPALVLGLPTGRTPVGFYHELASMAATTHADFSNARTFNLDEFFGIPPAHPGSYRQFMEHHLFSRVNLRPENVHFLDGSVADSTAECVRYETAIEEAGGIDVQILGIGFTRCQWSRPPGIVSRIDPIESNVHRQSDRHVPSLTQERPESQP